MREIKMGILGCGSIAEIAHFPSIAKCKEAKLVAVCDTDADRAQAVRQEMGG